MGKSGLPRRELIKVDFTNRPCLSPQAKFKHQPKPLSLYLRAKKVFSGPRFSSFFPHPLKTRSGRNFCISWSWGFGPLRHYENFLVGALPFCFTLFFLHPSAHHGLRKSYLSKHFLSVCAFCLLIKVFPATFYFLMNLKDLIKKIKKD